MEKYVCISPNRSVNNVIKKDIMTKFPKSYAFEDKDRESLNFCHLHLVSHPQRGGTSRGTPKKKSVCHTVTYILVAFISFQRAIKRYKNIFVTLNGSGLIGEEIYMRVLLRVAYA